MNNYMLWSCIVSGHGGVPTSWLVGPTPLSRLDPHSRTSWSSASPSRPKDMLRSAQQTTSFYGTNKTHSIRMDLGFDPAQCCILFSGLAGKWLSSSCFHGWRRKMCPTCVSVVHMTKNLTSQGVIEYFWLVKMSQWILISINTDCKNCCTVL